MKGERAGGGQGAARRDARHEKTRQVAQRACSSDDGSGVGAAPEGDDGGRHGGGSGGKGHARGSAGQASVTRGGQAGARGMRGRRALAGRGTRGNDTGPPSRDAPHTAPAAVGGRARAIRDTRQRVARGRAPPPQTGHPGGEGKRRDAPAPTAHNRAMPGVGDPSPPPSPLRRACRGLRARPPTRLRPLAFGPNRPRLLLPLPKTRPLQPPTK